MYWNHVKSKDWHVCAAVLACSLVAVFSDFAPAANYYIDPNYAGVEGAPLGSYAGAYKNIATALGTSGIPAGA